MLHHQRPVVHAQVFTPSGKQEAYVAPQAIDQQKIAEVVQQFADGARNAVAAGALCSARAGVLHMKRVRCNKHFAEEASICSQRRFSTCQSLACGIMLASLVRVKVCDISNSSLLSFAHVAGFDGVEIHGANGCASFAGRASFTHCLALCCHVDGDACSSYDVLHCGEDPILLPTFAAQARSLGLGTSLTSS